MRILTAEEMREVDRRAIEEIGVPSMVLMENAAIGVADALAERFPRAETVAIFCGPGNNGGDGLALARHLDARGYRCRVYLVVRGSRPGGDAGAQLAILEQLGIAVEEIGPDADLGAVREACASAEVLVDALFGTGLTRPLEGHFAELAEWLGRAPAPCLAVDLPSGLDGSRAEVLGPHGRAELTVTFAAVKVAHVFAPAADAVGEVVVTDLGIPPWLVEEAPGNLHLLTGDELAACLAPRAAASHKGTYGHALVVGGSPGKAGAVIMAARAAVRGGAGLVTAAVPEPLLATVDGGSLESMTLPLPGESLTGAAVDAVLAAVGDIQAAAVGPGLGTAAATFDAVRLLVRELAIPIVLDADGLNAFAGRLADLAQRPAPTVLTPHPGEMGRLLGVACSEVQADRVAAARRAAREARAVVVLKGHRSLVAAADGEVFVNPTGNPGMASGGSGDVLTGLVAALLAQGYEPLAAAQLGVYLHGLAGDLALVDGAPEALAAEDLIAALPRAFAAVRAA
ncbi:MAG TPA: NAD(P)H-hydrate dehydratase [Thermoanaerobaculia bacterium]|jgi:NAD(P)H-hydrate epimerase